MTLTQAASRLGRSYTQVLRLILIGEVEGWQEGGRWKVRRSSVERVRQAAEADATGRTMPRGK